MCKECRGESTYRLTGVYHDAVQGNCSTAAADSWARRHNLQVTFKCTFSQHAEGPSRIIVRAWCHRVQWFFEQEVASDSDSFSFTPELVASYLEPDELAVLARTLTKKESLSRVGSLRKIPFR